jgi:xanthine dehydrogenase accessory factor
VTKEIELWKFIYDRLTRGEQVMLLVVAESSGSSPGRAGYKMAVGSDGELCGSIGGGVMEVNLVNQSRALLSEPGAVATGSSVSFLKPQEHKRDVVHSSGMICSGRQTVIFKLLSAACESAVRNAIESLSGNKGSLLTVSSQSFDVEREGGTTPIAPDLRFQQISDTEFSYSERLGAKKTLYIVGGGHCSLALSELMSKLDFHITIFDDRPELNTIEKNAFAHRIEIIDSYEAVGELVPEGKDVYVVVMTLGYSSDETVIRKLIDKNFKYFGVLGSKAKMATLMKSLRAAGYDESRLLRINAPIGLPINSHTPEEIAVSIAAEIIAVKNEA